MLPPFTRRSSIALALTCAVAATLLLPGSAQPVHSTQAGAAVQGTFAVTKGGPATAVVGDLISYPITITRTGPPVTTVEQVQFTDQLPPQLVGPGMADVQGAISNCTFGQQVSCTASFGPNAASTVTFTIHARAIQEGVATNTISLSTGATASATTTIGAQPPPPRGSFSVTKTGPVDVTLREGVTPARFSYTMTVTYLGPPISPDREVRPRFVDRLPPQLEGPIIRTATGALPANCRPETIFSETAPPLTTYACDLIFTSTARTANFTVSVRPSGRIGEGTNVIELNSGDSASWTTNFVREAPPPPDPIPGPPAAPVRTVTETFTRPGEGETQSAAIAPTAKTAQIALTWPAGSSFDVTGIQLVPRTPGRTLAAAERRRVRLKISKRRTTTSLDVRIGRLKPGRLRFRIVARRVEGRTRVTARIRQSRRG